MAKDNSLPILVHLLNLFTGFIGPFIILLVSEDKIAKRHSRAALNWNFSLCIYLFISAILMIILIGFLFMFGLFLMNIVFCIIAIVKASEGKIWEYPMSFKFFKV